MFEEVEASTFLSLCKAPSQSCSILDFPDPRFFKRALPIGLGALLIEELLSHVLELFGDAGLERTVVHRLPPYVGGVTSSRAGQPRSWAPLGDRAGVKP